MDNTITPHRIPSFEELLDTIRNGLNTAAEGYMASAKAYVFVLDHYSERCGEIREAMPKLGLHFWNRLESVGRQQLDSRLLFGFHPGERYLRKLPYSQQRDALNHGVEVYTLAADDTDDHLRIRVENLTPHQCKQVFGPSGIRDLPAQRAWIETQRNQAPSRQAPSDMPRVRGGKLVIGKIELTKQQVLRYLAEMV